MQQQLAPVVRIILVLRIMPNTTAIRLATIMQLAHR